MSMEVQLVRTRFESLDEFGIVTSTTFGVRIYDDFGCTYLNTIDSLDALTSMSPDDLVDFASDGSEAASAMLSTIRGAEGVRLYVDGEIYDVG